MPGPARQPAPPDLVAARFEQLLAAVLAVGPDQELARVLRRLVEVAVDLLDAQYAALEVTDAANPRLRHVITVGVPPDGDHAASDHAANDHAAGAEPPGSVQVPVRAGSTLFGTLSLTGRPGSPAFSPQDRSAVVALGAAAGIAVQNAGRHQEGHRREAWREAGREISTALLSGTAPEQVIALVVARVHEVLTTDAACVVFARDGELQVEATQGEDIGPLLASLTGALREVLATGRPLGVLAGPYVGTAVPLGPRDRPGHGALVALWRQRPAASIAPDLTDFGAQAAVALELAERRREAEHFALVADRHRIGRDLHDLVIQRLFATGLQLQSAARLIEDQPQEAGARVNRAVDELDATIRELRSTIYGLQAPQDGPPSLRARLLEVAHSSADQLGFTPSLRLEGLLDTVVPPEIAEHTLATVREALSNVVRHARARQLTVIVAVHEGLLTVQVHDDGVGVPPSNAAPEVDLRATPDAHSGLRNLADRAAQLGGGLRVLAADGGGTRLVWQVPV